MKIAVLQHTLAGDDAADAAALGGAAADATDYGADVVVFPPAPVLADTSEDPVVRVLSAVDAEQVEHVAYVNPAMMPDGVYVAGLPLLGQTALMIGDACMDRQEILTASGKKPQAAILVPRSENELQAEAMLELAIGLSSSLAGLVVVVDTAGAPPGEPGHGKSAIVHLGEVLAEAMDEGDETLFAEVVSPIPQPEPRELLPEMPSILLARVAHHQGQKPEVEYPADLD